MYPLERMYGAGRRFSEANILELKSILCGLMAGSSVALPLLHQVESGLRMSYYLYYLDYFVIF
jgi:hypothetical protein